ncbi:MAG TPA: hypothetical protein VGD43_00320 [Micromonospora sp.]
MPFLSLSDSNETHWAEKPRRRLRFRVRVPAGLSVLGLIVGVLLFKVGVLTREQWSQGELSFAYTATSGTGYMNQTLSIVNNGDRTLQPRLRIAAVDRRGEFLPNTSVSTVFGSDVGRLVVPPIGAVDVLIFGGPGLDRVADVRVTAWNVQEIDFARIESEVRVQPLDEAGQPVTRDDLFTSVVLANDNAESVTVRLVYVVWDEPLPGRTQQAQDVVPVVDLVTVPGVGSVRVPVVGDAKAANQRAAGVVPASIKAYFSRPPTGLPGLAPQATPVQ